MENSTKNRIFGTKALALIIVLMAIVTSVTAQTKTSKFARGYNYQAIARNATGDVLVNKPVVVEISIRKTNADGVIMWQEGHTVTTNEFGLFTLVIGEGVSTGNGIL